MVLSEFLDLNHTSKSMILVSLMISKFAPEPSSEHRRTSESDTRKSLCSGFSRRMTSISRRKIKW